MADFSPQDETSNDGFFLHEAYVVWEIALQDASVMQQNPSFVHLFGASLYRLRDSDLTLAKELRVTFYHTRDWVMTNLPTTNPFGHSYEGPIDFDYTVARRLNQMHVGKVRKPPTAPPPSPPEHVHAPGGGMVVRMTKNDPAANELWAASMKPSLQFAQAIHADAEPLESPAATARRALVSLLAEPEVQTCLRDIGMSAEELRAKLGEPFDQ